jgi:branched-subunit amino acid transport protein AzlD
MNRFRGALTGGLRQARRVWLILPLYMVGLILGLVQTWPLLVAGSRDGLRNPFLAELAAGGSDAVLDLFIGSAAARTQALVWAAAALLLTPVFGLAYSYFSGGMLSVAAGTLPFWMGCRRFFWSFLGLGMLLVTLGVLAVWIASLGGIWLGSLKTGLLVGLLLVQALNIVGEYARAIAVVRRRRNPFVLFGAALAFSVRHLGGVLALALLGLLLHGAVAALYIGLGNVPIGAGALVVQQFVVLLWLWVKLLRLTWALSYVAYGDRNGTQRTANDDEPSTKREAVAADDSVVSTPFSIADNSCKTMHHTLLR